VQSAAVPLLAALGTMIVLRLLLGTERNRLVGGVAIAVGFVAGYVAMIGLPSFPPRGSGQKLAYIAAIGGALGFLMDLAWPRRGVLAGIGALGALAAVAWLGQATLLQMQLDRDALVLGIAAILGVIFCVRLGREVDHDALAAVGIFVASLALAAIAFLGASASAAQLAGTLAAATGGYLLWNWPIPRTRFAAAALLGAGVTLVAIATQLALFTRANTLSLAVLSLVALAGLVPVGEARPWAAAIVRGFVAAVPAAAATAIAYSAG
jgi:hypothetical protein